MVLALLYIYQRALLELDQTKHLTVGQAQIEMLCISCGFSSVNLRYFSCHSFPQIALSALQIEAETEIHKAQKLVSEKDAELHAAEESLPGLEEVLFCHFAWLVSCALVYLKTGFSFFCQYLFNQHGLIIIIQRERLSFCGQSPPAFSCSMFVIVVSSNK